MDGGDGVSERREDMGTKGAVREGDKEGHDFPLYHISHSPTVCQIVNPEKKRVRKKSVKFRHKYFAVQSNNTVHSPCRC